MAFFYVRLKCLFGQKCGADHASAVSQHGLLQRDHFKSGHQLGTGTGVDSAEQFFILQNAAAQNDETGVENMDQRAETKTDVLEA